MRVRSTSLRGNFIWTVAGNALYAATQWGMLIVLARLGSPALVGRYVLALTITAPIILLCNLQLRVVQATDVLNKFRFGDFVRLRALTCTAQVVLNALVATGLGYTGETFAVIMALGFVKVVEGMSDILYGALQKHEWMARISISLMLKGVLSLATLALILHLTRSLIGAVFAMGAVWLAVLLLFDLRSVVLLRRQLGPDREIASLPPGRGRIPVLLRLALPLGFVSMLVSSFWTLPRYLLELSHGEETLAYFAVIAYFVVPATTIVEAFGQSSISRLARYHHHDQAAFIRLLVRLLAAAAAIGLVGVLVAAGLGRRLLNFFYGPGYAAYADVFPWMMGVGGLICLCSVLGVALTATGAFRTQLWISGSVLLINAAIGFWLIPTHMVYGTTWTVLIGAAIWCCLSIGVVLWRIKRHPAPDAF